MIISNNLRDKFQNQEKVNFSYNKQNKLISSILPFKKKNGKYYININSRSQNQVNDWDCNELYFEYECESELIVEVFELILVIREKRKENISLFDNCFMFINFNLIEDDFKYSLKIKLINLYNDNSFLFSTLYSITNPNPDYPLDSSISYIGFFI